MQIIEHWIGGKPTAGESDRLAPVWNPATGAEQARVRLAGEADVDAAVQAAKAAFPAWSRQSLTNRSRVMFRLRDQVRGHPPGIG